jgi:hypothetical protein
MKKIIFFVLALVGISLGQTKYFLPTPVTSSSGRPIANQTVTLYQNSVLTETLTWQEAGRYYYTDTTVVTPGVYDIYINGIEWQTGTYLNYGANTAATTAAVISDSIAVVPDTVALQLKNMAKGRQCSIKQLSSTNPYGATTYTAVDSGYPETHGGTVYNHITPGLQWVENEFLRTGITNAINHGARPDSLAGRANTTLTTYAFNGAMDFAYLSDRKIMFIPPGEYVYATGLTGDTGLHYGIMFEPGVEIRGAGQTNTVLFADTAHSIAFYGGERFETVPFLERTVKVSNLKLVGVTRYGEAAYDAAGSAGQGMYIARNGYRLHHVVVNNLHIVGFSGIGLAINLVDQVLVSNIFIEYNNFSALNFSGCLNVVVNNFIGDRNWFGMENAGGISGSGAADQDSLQTFMANNVDLPNTRGYGIKLYGGSMLALNNIYISGIKDTTATGEQSGIWLDPHTHTYGFGNTIFNNVVIDGRGGAKYHGIEIRSPTPAADDSSLGNIKIMNSTITGCRVAGIFVQPYDSTLIDNFEISNCYIFNNNTDELSGLGVSQVQLYNTDFPLIRNNKIYYNLSTAAGSFSKHPVLLSLCYQASVYDNNFEDPTGVNEYSVIWQQHEPLAYNNIGTILGSATLEYTPPSTFTGYYQHAETMRTGLMIGGSRSVTGNLQTMIDDTLCTVLYNTIGAAVDTIRVHPVRP